MPSKNNITQVEVLTEKIGKAKAIYFTDFLGLDVSSITELRSQFFQASIEYTVAKNTLIKLAAQNNQIEGIEEFFSGPTALAISYNESIIPAKILKVFKKTHEKPTVKGIIFEGEVLQGDEFNRIATLPSREESLTQLVAMFISPLTMFVNTLNASMSELVGVLRSLKEKKSE